MKDTTVIYNGECPVCSREIGVYKARAVGPVRFVDLNACDMSSYGLSPDAAARRLHVVEDGRLLAVIRQLAGAIYEGVLAPVLYRQHLRRTRAR